MIRTYALTESISANLHDFLHRINPDLTQPQKKFLPDGLVGLLRASQVNQPTMTVAYWDIMLAAGNAKRQFGS